MRKLVKYLDRSLKHYWQAGVWQKICIVAVLGGLLALGTMYGIARWYMASAAHQRRVLGVSFIPAYAESLGLEPMQTMDALINDVGVRHFRLVSYWDQLEPVKDEYNFELLDWQMKKAEDAGAKVTLSLGLRQPRWPECHMPSWAMNTSAEQWQPQLEAFISEVVQRYKNSPALDSYQLENEFLLKGFGLCETIPSSQDRWRLIDEYKLVKKLDPQHTLIISRSNNALGTPIGQPTPDEFGISIYKRVWSVPIGRYIEYPFPAWYYAFVAGVQKLTTGRDMLIHELQAEAWPPKLQSIPNVSLEEQNKSFNAERFTGRLQYMEGTGMKETYLWGAEYWYYRLTRHHDDSLWNVAREAFNNPRYTD